MYVRSCDPTILNLSIVKRKDIFRIVGSQAHQFYIHWFQLYFVCAFRIVVRTGPKLGGSLLFLWAVGQHTQALYQHSQSAQTTGTFI